MIFEAVPPAVADRIRSAVLKIHSRKLEGAKLDVCLRETYDAYARELIPNDELESDEVLNTHIPGWIFRDAVEFRWMPYPPKGYKRREKTHRDSWIPDAKTIWWEAVPVPDADLTETLGGYRVNRHYMNLMAKILAGRIAFWKGEVMSSPASMRRQQNLPIQTAEVPSLEALPTASITNSTARRAAVDAFLLRCRQETSLSATRKHIWKAVGHKTARQFQFWQANDAKATLQDDKNFRRILAKNPVDFESMLTKKGII